MYTVYTDDWNVVIQITARKTELKTKQKSTYQELAWTTLENKAGMGLEQKQEGFF